jgi:hypothetical protein
MEHPTEQKFLATQLSEEEKEQYHRLKQYAGSRMAKDDSCFEIYQEKCSEASKIRKKLEIVLAQEKPKSVESEEATVRYWEQQLSDYQQKVSGETNLLDTLAQTEGNYIRKKAFLEEQFKIQQQQMLDNYLQAKQTLETRLEQSRLNRHGKESFFGHRLQAAKQILDDRRNHKSAPRIKLEMELAEPQRYINRYKEEVKGCEEWEELTKILNARKKIWTAAEWARLEREEPEVKPPPQQKKVMRSARKSAEIQTQSVSSDPAEHSSVAASEGATTEHLAPDQQTSPP